MSQTSNHSNDGDPEPQDPPPWFWCPACDRADCEGECCDDYDDDRR